MILVHYENDIILPQDGQWFLNGNKLALCLNMPTFILHSILEKNSRVHIQWSLYYHMKPGERSCV